MPHERTRQRVAGIESDIPKPQIDEESIFGKSLGVLQGALSTIVQTPGIKQTFAGLETVASTAGGIGSAGIRIHKGVIEDQGWGGWAQAMLNPFDSGDVFKAKFDEIIGLDDQAGFMDTLRTAANWQRNRNSAFFGEKFLSEMLFDPLTWVPLGIVGKVAGRAGRIVKRTPAQIEKIKRTKLANISNPHVVNEVGEQAVFRANVGFDDDIVRRVATTVFKSAGKIPFGILKFPFQLINPSGVVRTGSKSIADRAEIRTYIYGRHLDQANGVIAGDIAYMRLKEMDAPFDLVTRNKSGKDQLVVKGISRKPAPVDAAKPVDEDILLGDVLEFPDNYVLSAPQRELVDEGYRLIEGYKQKLVDEGIEVTESVLGPEQHYWPRFVDMYNDFKIRHRSRSGASVGELPSSMKQRFFDEFGEGVNGGIAYMGKDLRMPLSDVIHAYMNMSLKQVIDKGYMDDLLTITQNNALDIRKLMDKGPNSLNFAIDNLGKRKVILQRVSAALDDWQATGAPPGVALFDELDTIDDFTGLAVQLRGIVNPYVRNRLGTRVIRYAPDRKAGEKLPREIKQEANRQRRADQRIANYRRTVNSLLSETDTNLKQYTADRKVLKDMVNERKAVVSGKGKKAVLAYKTFPLKTFADPEFNAQLFPREVVDRIMPKLATRDEIIRQKGVELAANQKWGPVGVAGRMMAPTAPAVSGAIGAAAGFGRMARSFQLTYDLGVQFLQGAVVATSSPRSWIRAVGKMLSAWNNPQKHMEYLSDPATQEVLQIFQGRLHVGSTEFTEALQRGSTFNRAVGNIPIAGRATEKFRTSFDTFGDVARIEMAKAWLPMINRGRITVDQVANHLNKMSGISSSRKLGIGAAQRELESAAIALAPNYLRATTALMADAARFLGSPHSLIGAGRWETQQAVFALTRFFGGTILAYVGIAKGLGQEPKLNPRSIKEGGDGGAFMTVVVDGQRVGLGTKPYSIVRRVTAMAININEGRWTEAGIEAKDFFRGQTAPMTSSAWDIIRGETAIGEPVQSAGERIHAGITSRLMPFWVEAAVNDSPKPTIFGTAADFVGLRNQPLSYSAMRWDVRNELAAKFPVIRLTPDQQRLMKEEFMSEPTWEMLSRVQKGQIERGEIPELHRAKVRELQRFDEVVRDQAKRIGRNPQQLAYFNDLEGARSRLEIETEKHQILYEEGEITPYYFRKIMSNVNAIYADDMRKIHAENGPHEEYFQEQEQNRQERAQRGEFEALEDKAYQEYIDRIIAAPELNHYRGAEGYDFVERDRREAQLRRKYGDAIIDGVKRQFQNNKKVSPLYKQLQLNREDLAPYWDIQNSYVDRRPILRSLLEALQTAESNGDLNTIERIKDSPKYRAMNIDLRRAREELRISHPRLDAILRFWRYNPTLKSTDAEIIYRRLITDAKRGIYRE